MRYTAATVDPDDFTPTVGGSVTGSLLLRRTFGLAHFQFSQNGYELRQKTYGRDTELLVRCPFIPRARSS
jgi:hypothetical protein